jgi:hypothetical protein
MAAEDESTEELPEDDPAKLVWFISGRVPVRNDVRQQLLEMTSIRARVRKLLEILREAVETAEQRALVANKLRQIARGNGRLAAPAGLDEVE